MIRARVRLAFASVAAVLLACAFALLGVSPALAVPGAPAWSIDSFAAPTAFSSAENASCAEGGEYPEIAEECDSYTVTVTDAGAQATTATKPMTIKDTIPQGLSVSRVSLVSSETQIKDFGEADCPWVGRPQPQVLECKIKAGSPVGMLRPDGTLKMFVFVTVNEGAQPGRVLNTATVSGDGGGEASVGSENTLDGAAPSFGLAGFTAPLLGTGGLADTQAGGHAYELPAKFDFSGVWREDPEGHVRADSVSDLRDVIFDLPLGLAGSAAAVPQCTYSQLDSRGPQNHQGVAGCPTDTEVGYIRTFPEGFVALNTPIYNLVPERGTAAQLGFVTNLSTPIVVTASIAPTPSGYVLRSTSREVPQALLGEITANVYGDPQARDRVTETEEKTHKSAGYTPRPSDTAMFTNPSVCTGEPLTTTVYMDSWQAPGSYNPDGTPNLSDPRWVKSEYSSPPVEGCEALEGLFNPELLAHPESSQAESPTGIDVNVKVREPENGQSPETLAAPPLRDTVITFPEGLTVNPSSANGLGACSETQIGWQGNTPAAPGELDDFNASPPACPNSSKLGTVELETPALPKEACKHPGEALQECATEEPLGSGIFPEREKTPLTGSIYLATQDQNPFASLIALYIVVDDPRTGVLVKIPVEVQLNPTTGQLSSTVTDTPQFPFSELRTHFFAGPDASLKTPQACGTYTISSVLTPWSAPQSGPPAEPSSAFEIDQGPGGGPCSAPGFAPSFQAGTTGTQAGAFTPLAVTFSRNDGEQQLGQVSVSTPPGLAGIIKNVTPCPEPQASQGNCGPQSLIGEATSAVGAGPKPYWVHGGQVYLTGPYDNGPFGLSIVVPTTAGPFTLTGNAGYGRELVRSSIRINPATAQVTTVSDPLPTIIQGIPLDIRTVNVTLNRPGFLFNPTNCSALATTATFTSTQNTSAQAATPFYTSGCAGLPFAPKLTATVAGKGSKANGTAFTVKITSPGLGQANIHKVDLTIPAKLPSRLSTIEKACLQTTFNTNPAACDPGSVIGEATVYTPIFKNPLKGPAYLVARGGAQFPDVEYVLQGEGVTIILDGQTDIKHGITYSKFETAPDAPFTTFETTLPAGPHSAFTTNVPEHEDFSLCHQPTLTMPTQITAQNGALISQTTLIETTGCPTAIAIITHNIKGHTLTLTVWVPAAGKLRAAGKHLHTTTTTSKTREIITLKLHITTNHKTKTQLTLTYTPKTTHKQTTHTKIKI